MKEIEALGVKGGFTKCDVAVEEDVKKLIADAAAFGGGKIDVIVNAAGVISLQDMMHTTTEEVQRLFNINVVGTVHMIKHGLAHLEANKSGNMILVSSIAGRDGMGMLQTYSASKAAVTSLMQSAAKHAAPYGVRVNAILPGIIRTAMWEEILEGMNNGWDPEVHNELTPEKREELWNASVKSMIHWDMTRRKKILPGQPYSLQAISPARSQVRHCALMRHNLWQVIEKLNNLI